VVLEGKKYHFWFNYEGFSALRLGEIKNLAFSAWLNCT
jgi:hypothetical protein